jgi:hypothetical protein
MSAGQNLTYRLITIANLLTHVSEHSAGIRTLQQSEHYASAEDAHSGALET